METIIDDANLKIVYERGDGSSYKTVVSFTGVGFGFGAIQKEEFARTLRVDGGTRDIYYVIDKDRKWYNTTGEKIANILIEKLSDKEVFTLGNSMGGFGALLFSSMLPNCRAAIAFCPQYSVNRKIIATEHRFDRWVNEIEEWRYDTCINKKDNHCKRLIFFGGNDKMDRIHEEHFRKVLGDKSAIFSVNGCGHDVGQAIKDISMQRGANTIHEIIDAVVTASAPSEEIGRLLMSCNIYHSCWRPLTSI
jgi:hypothetical protein